MTLRIEKVTDKHKTIIRLSGRLQAEHLDALKVQVAGEQSAVVLDLEGVTLVDIEIVRFLNTCEQRGVEVLRCSPYIREWMRREHISEKITHCSVDHTNDHTPEGSKQVKTKYKDSATPPKPLRGGLGGHSSG